MVLHTEQILYVFTFNAQVGKELVIERVLPGTIEQSCEVEHF